jgi:hypothetical protein
VCIDLLEHIKDPKQRQKDLESKARLGKVSMMYLKKKQKNWQCCSSGTTIAQHL